MNTSWSEQNKEMQLLLKHAETFREGLACLTALRGSLFAEVSDILSACPPEALSMMPFPKAEGYHSKTLTYSVWHIFRIEDITAHELIARDRQVLFTDAWQQRVGSPTVTTGNELTGEEIAAFSAKLDPTELLRYASAVRESTEAILAGLSFPDLRRRFTDEDRERLRSSGCVSPDESAAWLIDYWCGKDTGGLIRMPFSRHWIMHIEAMLRIREGLRKKRIAF